MKKIVLIVFAIALLGNAVYAQSFTGSFKMIVSGNKFKQPTEMMCYYKDKKMAMEMSPEQMKGGKMRIIYEPETQEALMLMDMNGKKMGFKSKTKDLEKKMMEKNPPKITETAEAKTIDGHLCKKIIAETEDATIDMWVAQDIDFDLRSVFANMKGPQSGDWARYAGYFKGPSLETLIADKKKGTKTLVQIKEISKGNVPDEVFNSEGYEIMANPMMGGKE